jgi:glycine/D-amino acid oxidase-like deaminating enzyme
VLIGGPSYWFHELGGLPPPRPALPGSLDVDVAIVGAGFTGLWTAYYLKRADPGLRIAVLERDVAGYGASGRNGGWVSGVLAGDFDRYAEGPEGVAGVTRTLRTMHDTVDEVGRVSAAEGIDCDFRKGGTLAVATNAAQLGTLRASLHEAQRFGLGPEDERMLAPVELAARVAVHGAHGATFTPHCARVQPARLVRGLADVVERLGVTIYERTAVRAIVPRCARAESGDVRADWVVRATEGYTAQLAGLRRAVLPLNSTMIATEPLPDATWAQLGWDGCETIHDAAHAYVYLQRTADGRIAIGGRGVPYRFASGTDRAGECSMSAVRGLERRLLALFPSLAGVRTDHAWSGVLGVPRDWSTSVGADPYTGIAFAGCYVGVGVATSNLAGRVLADLLRGERSDLVTLPFVQHVSRRKWEPEPVRWLAVNGLYAAYRRADAREERTGRRSAIARVADLLSGRHG